MSTVDDALSADQLELVRRYTDGIAVFLLGPANVATQLARRPVGRGVVESPVHSGSVYEHPFKRFRTTIGYVDIAMTGDAGLRADYRRAVDGQHRRIRSGPDSPVAYNAFDHDLQLWVASCLYHGYRDSIVRLHGPLTAHEEELLLQASARFGTTLQVPEEMWHADRAAFEAYWAKGLRDIEVDDQTRAYLLGIIEMDILPWPLSSLLGPPLRFFNTGFLPLEVREALGLAWTPRQERRMHRILRTIGAASRPLPHTVRRIPANWMTMNIRLRRALGRPLV
jgi:uncharacterized protein (DUF2236 family)